MIFEGDGPPCKRVAIFSIFAPTIEIANRLGRNKISVLLVLASSTRSRIENVESNVTVCYFGKRGIRNPLKILSLLARFRPDLIHMWCSGGIFATVLLPFLEMFRFFTNCPRISTVMEPTPRLGMELTFSARLRHLGLTELQYEIKSASHIITTNIDLQEVLEKQYGLSCNRIDIIPHLEWDASDFEKWKKDDINEEKWVLFFGTASENKGLEYLIKAEPLITSKIPEAKIVIAGKGQSKYYSLIKHQESFLLFDRFINFEEGAELFQKSALVVLPYTVATMSGVIGEAYVFGKPIVASNIGGFPEFIDDGKTGILVPPRDSVALASAITYLLENEQMRKTMGKLAYKKLKSEFSWDVYSKRLLVLYNNMCG